MMRKKILLMATGLLILAGVTGCEKTPESVKEKAKQYETGKQEKRTSIAKVKPDEILDNEDAILNRQYQNLEFGKNVTIEQPEGVYVLNLQVKDNFGSEETMKKIMEPFFHTSKYNQQIERMDIIEECETGCFALDYDGENSDNAALFDNGFSYLQKKDAMLFIHNRKAIYHVDWQDELDDTYVLDGKEVSINEAAQYVEKWCNENWKVLENEYSYKVKTAYVCEKENKDNYFSFDVCKVYKGIAFDDIQFFREETDNVYVRNMLEVTMDKKGELSGVRNNECSYDIKEQSCEEVIGLQQAIELAETKMSGEKKIEISDIDIKYVICAEPQEGRYYDTPKTEVTARPNWSFTIDCPANRSTSAPWTRTFINVDMITGEVMYQNDCLLY